MKPNVVVRKNRFFCIDEKVLPSKANTTPLKGALYAAIHQEFKGAAYSDSYKKLTPAQRLQALNDYAWKWLNDRGFK